MRQTFSPTVPVTLLTFTDVTDSPARLTRDPSHGRQDSVTLGWHQALCSDAEVWIWQPAWCQPHYAIDSRWPVCRWHYSCWWLTSLSLTLLLLVAQYRQVAVAEWLAHLTAVWEDPGSNHTVDSCVHRDRCCDILPRAGASHLLLLCLGRLSIPPFVVR